MRIHGQAHAQSKEQNYLDPYGREMDTVRRIV
jgi:hypothetical protein